MINKNAFVILSLVCILILTVVVIYSVCNRKSDHSLLDKPIAVSSLGDVIASCSSNLKADALMRREHDETGMWTGDYEEAVTHICTYASSFCGETGNINIDRLMVSLCDGYTPRRIIILGNVLHINRLRMGIVSGEFNGSNKLVAEESINIALATIGRYLQDEVKNEPTGHP